MHIINPTKSGCIQNVQEKQEHSSTAQQKNEHSIHYTTILKKIYKILKLFVGRMSESLCWYFIYFIERHHPAGLITCYVTMVTRQQRYDPWSTFAPSHLPRTSGWASVVANLIEHLKRCKYASLLIKVKVKEKEFCHPVTDETWIQPTSYHAW